MSPALREVMEKSWSEDPEERPHFEDIVKSLLPLVESKSRGSYVDRKSDRSSDLTSHSGSFPPAGEDDGKDEGELLWDRICEEAETTKKGIPIDDFILAFEEIVLLGDVPDEVSFKKLVDFKGNDHVSKMEFKKFHRKWKENSDWKDDLPRYLTAVAEAAAETERKEEEEARRRAEEGARKAAAEKKRKAEEEARRKAEEEARKKAEEEARKAADEKKRKEEEEAKRIREQLEKAKKRQAGAALRLWIGAGGKEEDLTGGKGHDELSQWAGIETNADGVITKINWHNKRLSGRILEEPLGQLTALTYLGLDGNKLTGEIPSSIGNLTNLTTLYLL